MRRFFTENLVWFFAFVFIGFGLNACGGKGAPPSGVSDQSAISQGPAANQAPAPAANNSAGTAVDREAMLQAYATHTGRDLAWVKNEAVNRNTFDLIGRGGSYTPDEVQRVANFIGNTDYVVQYLVTYGVRAYNRVVYAFNPPADSSSGSRINTFRGSPARSLVELTVTASLLQRVSAGDLKILGIDISYGVAEGDIDSTITAIAATMMKDLIDDIEKYIAGRIASLPEAGSDINMTQTSRDKKAEIDREKKMLIGVVNAFTTASVYYVNGKEQFYLMPNFTGTDVTFTYYTINKPVSFATAIAFGDAFTAKIKGQITALEAKDSLTVSEFTWYTWLKKEYELIGIMGSRSVDDFMIRDNTAGYGYFKELKDLKDQGEPPPPPPGGASDNKRGP